MGLFQKSTKDAPAKKDNLPQYVDSLLDAADLESVRETDSLIAHPVEYGIDKAIELLQKLPLENTQLVVSVVRHTLESASIDVDLVVDDAEKKAQKMQDEIATLNGEIALLKTQIAQKETDIVQTEATLKETQRVQELLKQASQPETPAVVPLNAAKR